MKKPVCPKIGQTGLRESDLLFDRQSVADNRTTMFGDHDIHCVTTFAERKGHDLTAKNPGSAANQFRCGIATACRHACGDFIGAAVARVLDGPSDGNWRWGAADWLAAVDRCAAAAQ